MPCIHGTSRWQIQLTIVCLLVGSLCAVAHRSHIRTGNKDPTPPVFGNQFVTTGKLTFFSSSNVTVNSTIWYDWDDQICRIDQDLGFGQTHAWINNQLASMSYYLILLNGDVKQCFPSHHANAEIPPPDLFVRAKAQWINREWVNNVYCDHWSIQHHLNRATLDLWVGADSVDLLPVRIRMPQIQLDVQTYDVGHFDKTIFKIVDKCTL